VWGRVKNVCKQNGLLILSVLAVVIGCLLGFFLRGKAALRAGQLGNTTWR
ncbi:unnamed protein product, partial [Tetraodon nigroviridis]